MPNRKQLLQAKLAVIATKIGIPLPGLLTRLRQVLGIRCEYCYEMVAVLRFINSRPTEQIEGFIAKLLEARKMDNQQTLLALKKEFHNGSR